MDEVHGAGIPVVEMTGELATLFEGKEIRVIKTQAGYGDLWIPLADLANAWGIDRSTPDKIVERNQEVFSGMCYGIFDVTSNTHVKCLNERGIYLMAGKLTASRLKNKAAGAAIIRFQRWVPELIQKYRKKEILPAEPQQPLIKEELDRAKLLAEATGGRLQEFQKIALEICGYGKYARALDTPEITHGEPGWYNPTQLAAMIGDVVVTAERVNHFLKNKGYQYRDTNNLWRLTAEGFVHGREYIFESPGGHREPRIAWRESILYASGLKRPVDESQLALPVRA